MSDTYPVNEIFGPTVQGEGPLAGSRTFFVRFAGCDFDCGAPEGSTFICDTRYAVLPKYPGWSKMDLTAQQIHDSLRALGIREADWITLSGGNPALFFDEALGKELMAYRLAMETQGSRNIDPEVSRWLAMLVISPKPPSSGMSGRMRVTTVAQIIAGRHDWDSTCLKYVAFNDGDLEWINKFDTALRDGFGIDDDHVNRFLSAGTPVSTLAQSDTVVQAAILNRLQWLFETVAHDERFHNYFALPQLHVLAWGQKRGV